MKKLFLLLMILLLSSCATSGTKIEGTAYDKIVEGVTSKNRVIELLGNPFIATMLQDGELMYTYNYARSSPSARNFIPIVGMFSSRVNTDIQQVSIIFDNRGIVKRKIMNNSNQEIRAGIGE